MTRIFQCPIEVETSKGEPIYFTFRGQHEVARILDRWMEAGEWWREGEKEREVFRVLTCDNGVFELERVLSTGSWRLYKVWD